MGKVFNKFVRIMFPSAVQDCAKEKFEAYKKTYEYEQIIEDEVRKRLKDELFKEIYQKDFDIRDFHHELDYKKVSIPFILDNYSVDSIRVGISFPSEKYGSFYEFGTVGELVHFMDSYIRSNRSHSFIFSGFMMYIFYNHPEYGRLERCEVVLNSLDDKIYRITELEKIFVTINSWVEDKPELLI